jgi:hypothetical protein
MSGCGHFDYSGAGIWDRSVLDTYGLGIPAMTYQQLGYRVLPLVRGGKKPHRMLPETGGVHHGSLMARQAQEWWSQDPAANIGVATGSVSRLVVIDLDVKGEHDGPLNLRKFQYETGEHIPDGPVARTPSGGWHLWFRTPEGTVVPERPGILPGVDVKGDGGLVVAPPSMKLVSAGQRPGDPSEHSEVPVPYEWASGCPCSAPDAPGWLLPWLASVPETRTAETSADPGSSLDLKELKRTGIPPGERNQQFYKLACQLYRRAGISSEASVAVLEELKAVWDATDTAGFTWHEMLVIIASARRFVTGQIERGDSRRLERLEASGSMNWARGVNRT